MTNYEKTLRESGYDLPLDELDLDFQPRTPTLEEALDAALALAGLTLEQVEAIKPVAPPDITVQLRAAGYDRAIKAGYIALL